MRLLSASKKESGAWLYTLPVTSLGLRMDDNTICIAIGLRLGAPLCIPHLCHHYGSNVARMGSVAVSALHGRHFRHAMLNDLLHKALSSANVPYRLEPTGLDPADGNRPDGITTVPWSNSRLLVWDATPLPLPIYPSQPLKYVQQQTRRSRPRSRSIVNSPPDPMRTPLKRLESLHVFLDRLGSPHCEHHW